MVLVLRKERMTTTGQAQVGVVETLGAAESTAHVLVVSEDSPPSLHPDSHYNLVAHGFTAHNVGGSPHRFFFFFFFFAEKSHKQ